MWSLGVILFALVQGETPFHSSKPEELKRQILKDEPSFERVQLSSNCFDLIKKMLDKNPATRIQVREIMYHPWMLD